MNISAFLTRLKQYFTYGSRIDPTRDWLTILTLASIVLAGILAWNIWAFDTVANGGVIGSSSTTSPALFSQSSLDSIRAIFKNRDAEEAKYETGVYRFTDPSQ